MENLRILVVGFGNMATALVDGWLEKGLKKERVFVVGAGGTSSQNAESRGVNYTTDVHDVSGHKFDVILFAVKPQMFDDVLPLYKDVCGDGTLVVSIAAGVEVNRISVLTGTAAVVRVMPNTPCLVGAGMSGLYASDTVTLSQRKNVEELMQAVGETVWVDDESDMHGITALSGSGPAYVFLMMEALASAGESLGLPPQISQKLAVQTVYGAGNLAQSKIDIHPTNLREQVTSPNGTTEAGLKVLFSENFVGILQNAVSQSALRSQELSQ